MYEVTCSFFKKGTFLYFKTWDDIIKYMQRCVGWDYTIKQIDELPDDVREMHQDSWGVITYWAKDINKD